MRVGFHSQLEPIHSSEEKVLNVGIDRIASDECRRRSKKYFDSECVTNSKRMRGCVLNFVGMSSPVSRSVA